MRLTPGTAARRMNGANVTALPPGAVSRAK